MRWKFAIASRQRILSAGNLPSVFGPESGYLASANNRPAEGEVPVGFFFSPNDRMVRLTGRIWVRVINRIIEEVVVRVFTLK